MKLFKTFSIAVMVSAIAVSCDDFGDLNVDPNNPSAAKTELLLTNAQRSISSVVGSVDPILYVQYMSETQYDDAAKYATVQFDFNGWYSGPLQDLEEIIKLNSDEATAKDMISGGSNANQIASARIMKVYFFQMIVERWGPAPYSEALKGADNLRPAYDTQDAIFGDLLTELSQAIAQFDSGVGPTGDILFDGNVNAWKAFANAMRVRLALRLADANPSLARSTFESAASGVITSNVMYPYLSDAANQNPWYGRFQTRTDYAVSDVFVDYLKSIQDPRLLKYAEPAPDFDDKDGVVEFSDINGMPYDTEDPGAITNAQVSFPSRFIGAGGPGVGIQSAPLPIITVAEMHFAMAEAGARGWSLPVGDAPTHYALGVKASMEQWGVYDAAAYAAYMAQAEVAYNAANYKKSIGTQKWIALYPNGYEAWSEWRRLDYPVLTPHSGALNTSGKIPVRHAYPTSEVQLNSENYQAAVSQLGKDDESVKLYFDKN
jgi:hypothetical protein